MTARQIIEAESPKRFFRSLDYGERVTQEKLDRFLAKFGFQAKGQGVYWVKDNGDRQYHLWFNNPGVEIQIYQLVGARLDRLATRFAENFTELKHELGVLGLLSTP